MLPSDVIAIVLVCAKVLTAVVGVVFLISGLDDQVIDICYMLRAAYRRLFIMTRHAPLQEQQLLDKPEQPLAVMIPAWQESPVIRTMLRNARRTLNYTNYVIFVGTYPNDPATAEEVDALEADGAKVVRITLPHPGPSNKADCLNWIFHGIRQYEAEHQVAFQIYVMQDCEDVIHPLCYKLFNYLIPRKDMVQLPVLSLVRRWFEFTGGHYLDEFAQLHYKDLVVREMINRSLPAAGVGVAFSRRAFEQVAAGNNSEVFSTRSLTEDYDFGFRLKQLGLKQVFVRFSVVRQTVETNPATGKQKVREVREVVGVREFFPSSLRTATRQKSRWVIGIVMQGWKHVGWARDWRTNYMLYRDRKSVITNLASMAGYVIVAVVGTIWLVQWLQPQGYRFPPIVERGTFLWYLLLVNFALLVLRVLQRGYCVWRMHGLGQAFLSLPRSIWANVVNFGATARAIRIYVGHLRSGKAIAWDKTDHSYPALTQMPFRRRLGEVLVDRGVITPNQLQAALDMQQQRTVRLGEVLVQLGFVNESDLMSSLNAE